MYLIQSKLNNRFFILIFTIFLLGLSIRLYYMQMGLPLTSDATDNFLYATAINYYGYLPLEWSPPNNGWPIFLSFWFWVLPQDNTLAYMELQKIISITLSSATIFPMYLLCKKYFDEKLSIIGASLYILEPRIILNSTLGITEPLFILLIVTSLLFFLKSTSKNMIISFLLVSFSTIVRSEGLILFFVFTIMFFIKFKFSKEILKTYLPCLVLFLIILAPISIYKTEVSGNDAILDRVTHGSIQITQNNNDNIIKIFHGGELFIKFLGWIMIPSFLLFFPLGFIFLLKDKPRKMNFVFIFLILMIGPIFYAYYRNALDVRYFFVLYPIFCLISLLTIQKILRKTSRQDFMLVVIILAIFVSSIIFYEYKKMDYDKEIELFEISNNINDKILGINNSDITKYLRYKEIPQNWPYVFNEDSYQIIIIENTNNSENLIDYIKNSDHKLSHLVVSDDNSEVAFLNDLFNNEEKYIFLEKTFDGKENGFKQQLKIFKINYEIFENLNP